MSYKVIVNGLKAQVHNDGSLIVKMKILEGKKKSQDYNTYCTRHFI